jgi:putative ABC transport system ATP-binding protein
LDMLVVSAYALVRSRPLSTLRSGCVHHALRRSATGPALSSLRLYSTKIEPEKPKTGIISRFLPSAASGSASSFRKIVALAKPEQKPLLTAVGLLLVSSSVSMSIPFTIGKLIDFFSTANPQIPLGLSTWQASGALLFLFSVGAAANAGRAYLMKMSGEPPLHPLHKKSDSLSSSLGQRIVARLREQTYSAALHQEVEFVERGEGDVLSRLSVDTSIVGESVTQNLSDGLRAIVMSSVGLGAMFYLSPTLTTLMLCVVPPVSFGAVGLFSSKNS